MKRKYKKNITIEYRYQEATESEQVLEEVFNKIFSGIIQKQKQLREYFRSSEYKTLYTHLYKSKSPLIDFLQPIDKSK